MRDEPRQRRAGDGHRPARHSGKPDHGPPRRHRRHRSVSGRPDRQQHRPRRPLGGDRGTDGPSGVVVKGNRIDGGEIGLQVRDGRADLRDNVVTAATSHGLSVVGAADGSTVEGNSLAGAGASALDVTRVAPPAVVTVGANNVDGWHVQVSPSEYVSDVIRDHPLLPLWVLVLLAPARAGARAPPPGQPPLCRRRRCGRGARDRPRRQRRDLVDPALRDPAPRPGVRGLLHPGCPPRRAGRAMNRLLIGALCAIASATTACDRTVTATPHAAPTPDRLPLPRRSPPRRSAATARAPTSPPPTS